MKHDSRGEYPLFKHVTDALLFKYAFVHKDVYDVAPPHRTFRALSPRVLALVFKISILRIVIGIKLHVLLLAFDIHQGVFVGNRTRVSQVGTKRSLYPEVVV